MSYFEKVMGAVAEFVIRTLQPVADRVTALEKRSAEKGDKGDAGEPGQAGERGEKGETGEQGLPGKDGRDGIDGKDGAPGRDGADGAAGQEGGPGKDGEPGRDGTDGKDGAPGKDGERGMDGADGQPGKDGVDGKPLALTDVELWLEAQFSKWALSVERRVYEAAEKAIAEMPRPKDGADGLRVEDLVYDGLRSLKLLSAGGDVLKEVTLPVTLYRGVYTERETYQQHDMVSFGGNGWIAMKSEGLREKPGTPGNDSWRLAIRKGSDGKDLR